VATLGELIVKMRTDSAQFNAGMASASEATKKVGRSARDTQDTLARLASKGFGEVIPLSNRAENALERFFAKMSEGAGIMATAAKASIALGAGLLAFNIGQRVGEWLSLGDTVENYKKKVEDAKKEQDDFVATLSKQRSATQSLDKELANLTGNFVKVIELEKSQRDANILSTFKPGNDRTAALAKSGAIATEALRVELEKQAQARDKFAADTLKALVDERAARFKTWQDETDAFVKQLSARAQARQSFEAQFGQGGLAGTAQTQGIRDALDLQSQITKELRDLAFAKREGFVSETDTVEGLQNIRDRAEAAGQAIREKFGNAFPAVDSAIQKSLASVTDLGSQFDAARGFIDRTVPTLSELTSGLQQFNGMLASMPDATASAQGALATLADQYATLNAKIVETTQNAAVFARVIGQ